MLNTTRQYIIFEMNKKQRFIFFALAAYGEGISGSDRIFIEFARRWGKKHRITLYVTDEGEEMCVRNNLKTKDQRSKLQFKVSKMKIWSKMGFVINYLVRIVEGIRLGLILKIGDPQSNIIYSASEFWMDSFPCLILKLRYPKIRWVAAWYQTAPNPLTGFGFGRYKAKSFLYWLAQLPIKPLISRFADFVLVNNENEKKQFPRHAKASRAVIVLGAVDLEKIGKWKLENGKLSKVYDAVFQGRFHPQKGVVELVDIWKKVVEEKPDAKLAMIGDGPLLEDVKSQISKFKLERNIRLFGFLFDGPEKYKIFAKSKIVVHTAYYDSGGMASAEAMAFGIPCVGFDLPSYKSYYPKGMLKVPVGDLDAFSKEVVKLTDDKTYNKKFAKEALEMIETKWSWEQRANEVLASITT